jgi:hypothetical protein
VNRKATARLIRAKSVQGGGGEFHHGDCVGADEQAAGLARDMGFRIIGHPPTESGLRAYFPSDEEREPKPYLERNRDIVAETEMLIAVPKEAVEQPRGGTWSTWRNAKKHGRRFWLLSPDGDMHHD